MLALIIIYDYFILIVVASTVQGPSVLNTVQIQTYNKETVPALKGCWAELRLWCVIYARGSQIFLFAYSFPDLPAARVPYPTHH